MTDTLPTISISDRRTDGLTFSLTLKANTGTVDFTLSVCDTSNHTKTRHIGGYVTCAFDASNNKTWSLLETTEGACKRLRVKGFANYGNSKSSITANLDVAGLIAGDELVFQATQGYSLDSFDGIDASIQITGTNYTKKNASMTLTPAKRPTSAVLTLQKWS